MKDILQNKLKQFIIIFRKILGVILVIILMVVFAVVPCLMTESYYFIISWTIFILTLYTTIYVFVYLFQLIKINKYKNILLYEKESL